MALAWEHATPTLDGAAMHLVLHLAGTEQPITSDVMALRDVMEALHALSFDGWELLPPAPASDALRTTYVLRRSK